MYHLCQKHILHLHHHKNPDSSYGFGIPNIHHAYFAITGIPVRLKTGTLELWPNPASEYLMISIPEDFPEEFKISFYDMQGRLCASLWTTLPGEISLPSALGQGMYVVEIRTGRVLYRSRLIVQ